MYDDPEYLWLNCKFIRNDYFSGAIYEIDGGILINDTQMISGFNPRWDDTEDSDDAFLKAVAFAEIVFDNTFANAVSKAKAQEIVDEAIEKSEGHVMVLDQFVPWQEFIFSSENEKATEVQFVVFPSNRGGFNWQCVPDALGSFGQGKSVPTECTVVFL